MAQAMKINVLDAKGNKANSIELPVDRFGRQANIPLMHQVVIAQLAAARQGTHSTKTRGEVSGGGRKPWKQKGTGRARQGSIRAPQWTGGGIAHGPKPRDYSQRTPKKMIAAALSCALSDRFAKGHLHVVSQIVDIEKPSTKAGKAAIEKLVDSRYALVVLARGEEEQILSIRNLPQVQLILVDQLNTYDVLNNDDVIFTEKAMNTFIGNLDNTEKEA